MISHARHISVSNIIKEKYNLSDKFILGSILPDLLKRINNDRRGTHYTKDIFFPNNAIKRLPDLEKFKQEHKKELENRNEEILGCFVHLIQDYIWFDKYVDRYVQFKVGNTQQVYMHYIKDMQDASLWIKIIYNDYAKNEKYILNKSDLQRAEIKQRILEITNDKQIKTKIEEEIIEYSIDENMKVEFLTKSQIDEYFNDCIKQIEKELKRYIINKYNAV